MSTRKYPMSVEEFKAYFDRDFPFLPVGDVENQLDYVRDKDISRAMDEANLNFNEGLFSDAEDRKMAFGYLTAHYLVIDLNNSAQGANGSFSGFMSSKSVGNVSVGYNLPAWILESPIYSLLARTNYGAKYLALIVPLMVGQVFTVRGTTQP